jgi:hypothetical protein
MIIEKIINATTRTSEALLTENQIDTYDFQSEYYYRSTRDDNDDYYINDLKNDTFEFLFYKNDYEQPQFNSIPRAITYLIVILVAYGLVVFLISIFAIYSHRKRIGYNYDEMDEEQEETNSVTCEHQRELLLDEEKNELEFLLDDETLLKEFNDSQKLINPLLNGIGFAENKI